MSSKQTPTAWPHKNTLVFDGTGSAYARLWLVNLALLIASLGLYFPWARARYWRFVHQHTLLDGQRFDYHADARRTWRPTWVFGSFLLLYAVASYIAPLAGFVAALGFAIVWPLVWRASAAFRANQTSWCGLRAQFVCTVEEAYMHLGLPLVLLIFPLAWLGVDKSVFDIHSTWTMLSGVALLAWFAMYPAVWWQSRRLKQNQTMLGRLTLHWHIRPATVMRAMLPTYAVAVLLIAGFAVVAHTSGVRFVEASGRGQIMDITYYRAQPALWGWLVGLAGAYWIVVRSMALAAGQRCLWSRSFAVTAGHEAADRAPTVQHAQRLRLRIRTTLDWRAVVRLQAQNTALLLLTLGLYWPWARMRLMALRIESTQVWANCTLRDHLHTAPAQWANGTDLSAEVAGAEMGL